MTDTVALQVLLDSVDVTGNVDLNEHVITVTSAINEELDTLDIQISDKNGTAVSGWQDIRVKDGDNKLFGGFTMTPVKSAATNLTKNKYLVGASDYGAYLKKVYYQGSFTAQTDKQIIAAVFAASPELADYDASSCVTAVRTIPSKTFNLIAVYDIIAWLATQSGARWYVDYDKKLHYFGAVQDIAPFAVNTDLTDAANAHAENVSVNVDATDVVNEIELIGGSSLGADLTYLFTKVGNGVDLYLDKKLSAWSTASKIVVRRNDGGATTNLVVNPSFETNITDGWTQTQAGTGAVWAQDTTKYNKGTKSLKITAGTAQSKAQAATTINLAPGEPLSVQAMTYCATAGMASIAIYDTVGLVALVEQVNRKTNAWEQLTATYINNTAAALTVRVELRNNAVDSATIAYFDGVQAEKLTWPSAYCDGSLGTGYAWTGTANNSTSTRVNMAVWTTLTVKTGNSDTLGARNEVLYYESEARLSQETYWPTQADAISIDGRIETPVHVVARNFASFQHYGKWMKTVITDTSITDPIVARIRCATELLQNAFETESISFDVRKPGLRAGQTLAVDLPVRGVSGNYLINRVTTTIGVGGHISSHVEVGDGTDTLVSLLMTLKSAQAISDSDISADEILNRALDFTDEFGFEDLGVTVSGTKGPYLYDVGLADYSTYGAE